MADQEKQSTEQILTELHTNATEGLTSEGVTAAREKSGSNELIARKRANIFVRILRHLKDITSLVLIFAVILSAYLTLTGEGTWTKTIVISCIVVLNVGISLFQEGRAEKAIASLQSMTTQTVDVLRDNERQQIDAHELVPGDIMLVKAGNTVAADAQLLESTDLLVEEAVLTGESEPVEKTSKSVEDAQLQRIFSGTSIIQGTAKAVVTETGMTTEMGKIAGMLNETVRQETPLAKRLNSLGLRLSVIAVLGGIISILMSTLMYGDSWASSVMIGIGLAIAAVPESLPVIVTLSLAYGVRQMAKRNAIVRQITAVETIGNVTVIASDKTGTLTQNKMTVTRFWTSKGKLLKTDSDQISTLKSSDKFALWSLASTAELTADEQQDVGSPTELAILRFIEKLGVTNEQSLEKYPQVDEDPFNSEKKSMSTLHTYQDKYIGVVKGAFDKLSFADSEVQQRLTEGHDQLAADGLRVLAGGYQIFDEDPGEDWAEKMTALESIGLVGIQDPPRAEVPAAIKKAHRAGIRTVMITGDHVETARTIATEIGILQNDELVVSGGELATMSDPELLKILDRVRVFARTTPSDKLRIVKLWQEQGEVVAMTGDGVNDAPALKAADVGIAMGITGTDVSKNAADMILVDDNFATIIEAVRQGRTVYQNILKAVEFLVSVNFSQIFTLLLSVLIGWGAPLSAEQMLIINILADGIPGFFLSQEPAEPGIMNLAPIKRSVGIWQMGLGKRVAVRTTTYVLLIMSVYAIGRFGIGDNNATIGMSMLFFVLAIGSVLDIFPIKSRQPVSRRTFTINKALTISILGTIAVLFIVGLTPSLARIFGVAMLPPSSWLVILVSVLIPMSVVEIYKRIQHRGELQDWVRETDDLLEAG